MGKTRRDGDEGQKGDKAPAAGGTMVQGSVKWFDAAKGYGFLTRDDGERDVFVHFTAIQGTGYRELKDGERVQFMVHDSAKGPQAAQVSKL